MGVSHSDYIIIINFGSQFVQLIARCVREMNVHYRILSCLQEEDPSDIYPGELKAIILSGSPASCTKTPHPAVPPWVFKKNVPVLGICYGQQIMVKTLGGEVDGMGRHELGRAILTQLEGKKSALLEGLQAEEEVWMSHGDSVTALPEGFEVMAVSPATPYAVIENKKRQLYGVQFHPEVTHTPCGRTILKNFLFSVAQCRGGFEEKDRLESILESIRKEAGDAHVLCAVSGGVDSAVLFALLHRALGERVTGVFVDTGLMRHNERQEVLSLFQDHPGGERLHVVDASSTFLKNLDSVTDPEEKRKIIGKTFIDVFVETVKKELPSSLSNTLLAQGTVYPDVIESTSVPGVPATVIKSHHNVGGLPQHMNMKLLEPLRTLFKDEVRALGIEVGLPASFIERHPFPGPGLALRIIGPVTEEKLAMVRHADSIFIEELKKEGLYTDIWQAFVVLTPVRTVGVVGDSRSYDYLCILRAVTSEDGMTADFFPFDMAFLAHVSNRITNEVNSIGRVAYDITSKPPATIEWE